MNTLTRTIAVLIALSILTPSIALGQDVSATGARDADAAKKEAAVLAAKKQVKISRERAKVAAKYKEAGLGQAETALARARSMSVARGSGYSTTSASRWPSQSGGAASVFVIPSAEIETKDLLTINEDINVMSRIFATSLQQARISSSGGRVFADDNTSALLHALSGRNRASMQSLYLQGYGVLFLMKVDFPLLPPLQTQQEDATEEKEEGDKVWEDTRRQLYEPGLLAKRKKDDSAVEYDAEKVENLKTTLIKALKHASNIRNLKPEESAILTITGGGGNGAMVTTHSAIVVSGREKVVHESPSSAVGSAARQALVIRAKKADIDSFAKGALDIEQFRQRVQMINYPLLEGAGGGGRAADFYYR